MGTSLRQWRRQNNLTQVDAATLLGVSQPYLSLLEKGARPLSGDLRGRLRLVHGRRRAVPADDRFRRELSALGYPGFAHVHPARPASAPDVVLMDALSQPTLDARTTEALPWLVRQYAGDLDWTWLVRQAKLRNLQNRMGFLFQLAASGRPNETAMRRALEELDDARLVAEATFCWDAMPASVKQWMREHRSPEAAHWNVVTRMRPQDLIDAPGDSR